MWLREISNVAVFNLRYSKLEHLLVSWLRKSSEKRTPAIPEIMVGNPDNF